MSQAQQLAAQPVRVMAYHVTFFQEVAGNAGHSKRFHRRAIAFHRFCALVLISLLHFF
jgi:hypothetical protein